MAYYNIKRLKKIYKTEWPTFFIFLLTFAVLAQFSQFRCVQSKLGQSTKVDVNRISLSMLCSIHFIQSHCALAVWQPMSRHLIYKMKEKTITHSMPIHLYAKTSNVLVVFYEKWFVYTKNIFHKIYTQFRYIWFLTQSSIVCIQWKVIRVNSD